MSNFEELLYSKGEEERLKQEADNLKLKLEEVNKLILLEIEKQRELVGNVLVINK